MNFVVNVKQVFSLFWRALNNLIDNEGIELAGYIAYTLMLAVFPFVIFLAALAGFFNNSETADKAISYILKFAPPEIEKIIYQVLGDIFKEQDQALLTFGILGTIWAAAAGVDSMRTGLNRAYHVKERRSFFWRKLSNVAIVISLGALTVFVSVIFLAGPFISTFVEKYLAVSKEYIILAVAIRYIFSLIFLAFSYSYCYQWLPAKRLKMKESLPGAFLAAILWIGLGSGFSFYLKTTEDYTLTYGSLASAVITLLFFHISVIIFLFGAEVNSEIRKSLEKNRL